MNLNTLSGMYLTFVFKGLRVNQQSMYQRLLLKNNNDPVALRDRLRDLVVKDPNVFNYSDDVAREILDTNNVDYSNTAAFLNQLTDRLQLNDGIPANQQIHFNSQQLNQLFHNSSMQNFTRNVIAQENKGDFAYATLFDREPMIIRRADGRVVPSPAFNNFFWMNIERNQDGVWDQNGNLQQRVDLRLDNQGRPFAPVDWRQLKTKHDQVNAQTNFPAYYQLPKVNGTFTKSADEYIQRMAPVPPDLMELYNQQMMMLGATFTPEQQRWSQEQQVDYGQSQMQVAAPVASSASQPVNNPAPASNASQQPVYHSEAPVTRSQNNQQNRVVNQRAGKGIAFGQYEVGQITRDNLTPAPVVYLPQYDVADASQDSKNVRNYEQQILKSNWDHNNGKYFWRNSMVAENSPVTVDELTKALSPYFATGNLESTFKSLIMESEGTDTAMSQVVPIDVQLGNSGVSLDQYVNDPDVQQAMRAQKITPANVYQRASSDLRNHKLPVDHLKVTDPDTGDERFVTAMHVLGHDGHHFSPSDVSKVQMILQTAQDAGIDYSLQSSNDGQIYLKVNDNRGMRVTLLDIDNPANIGAVRDRSGNEYQVDWTNVKVGNNADNSRPVFTYIDRNGHVNRGAQTRTGRADGRHFEISPRFIQAYDARRSLSSDEFNSLKQVYLNYDPSLRPSDRMDTDVYNAITQEMQRLSINRNQLVDRDDGDNYFNQVVSNVVRSDAMQTYKSLPEDYQKFMATVPMIEALGIDTRRLNTFQDLAKKYDYSNQNVVSFNGANNRLSRAISPTQSDPEIETSKLYNPATGQFEVQTGLGLRDTDTLTSSTDNGVMMRDSRFNNQTNLINEYRMTTDKADQTMAIHYHEARVNMLRSLNRDTRSDNDLELASVLDGYDQLVSQVAKEHNLDLSNEKDQALLSSTYALVTQAVDQGEIVNGQVHEDYQGLVLDQLQDSGLGDNQRAVAQDFAKQLYRYVNNETGTAILQVHDGYDHSPAHIKELQEAGTAEAKDELKDLNWYEEYGYHIGDPRHYYLDAVEQFTLPSQQNPIQYSFDLVNAAKQTNDNISQSFIAHDPVQSKVIQQRMVKFNPERQVYLNELSQTFMNGRFDRDQAFDDWMIDNFNSYMEDTNQKVDLAHLDEQYQAWKNQLGDLDLSAEAGAGERVILHEGRIVNGDGEVMHQLPDHVNDNWNKYFVDGRLMNEKSQAEEQFDLLKQVQSSLEDSGIMIDYVDLKSGKNISNQMDWMMDYRSKHPGVSNDDAAEAFQSAIDNHEISPSVAIDENGLIHWEGHALVAESKSQVAQVTKQMKRLHSGNEGVRQDAANELSAMMDHGDLTSSPVEGQLGQFFVPDRRNIIHTNYYVFPALKKTMTPEQLAALQDDQIAGYKAVIQSPREINQRGDINPADYKNFNERLILTSTPQVLQREIQENIRMQTAQMPLSKIPKTTALGWSLTYLSQLDKRFPDADKNILDNQPLGFSNQGGGFDIKTGRRTFGQPSAKVLESQMTNWYHEMLKNPQDHTGMFRLLKSKAKLDKQTGQVTWDPQFINDVLAHIDPTTHQVRWTSDVLKRRDYTRPEDGTIVNKTYGQEVASTKLQREDQFDAKDPRKDEKLQAYFASRGIKVDVTQEMINNSQETLNRAVDQLHHRMRLNNAVGESTNTAQILGDMQEIEDAVDEWIKMNPGKQPFSSSDFEYEIKNRVHSRVQSLGGVNAGMMADPQSLGYIDMLSTGQGKVQGLVRVLADNAHVSEDGHVAPAMIPVPMTEEEQAAYRAGKNDFDVMHVVAPDPKNPGQMKKMTYKMSRYLDGNALTKDEMFKYLSKLPFDRAFIAVEQSAKANYIDKNATLALMNANIMNMEDGSVVSKHFAETHPVIGADGELRPLMIGDKLSDTSGDKTTIAMVVDPDMSLEEAKKKDIVDLVQFMKKTGVDIVKSPLSQISRKNMSQVMDMIDSYAEHNEDGTVKIYIPKQVQQEFKDADGHVYHEGDLLPKFDTNNRPVHREPTDEEKALAFRDVNGELVKPIMTDQADHRKSLAELKKMDDNWIKFMNEGGPAAFKNGKKFVDLDGNTMKSWPTQMFEHTVTRDATGKFHVGYLPSLDYQMDPNPIDTNATIGNVVAYVTNILADNKVNNYGIDPDASTEGRKYSDLVANADAERNATALTRYLTSVDSSAMPDFREYLRLAGYEISSDGKVYSGISDEQMQAMRVDTVKFAQSALRDNAQTYAQVSDINSAAQVLGMKPEEFQKAYNNAKKSIGDQFDLPAFNQLASPEDWKLATARMQQLTKTNQHIDAYLEARSHPGEIRDQFSVEDMVNDNPAAEDDEQQILAAIGDANSKSLSVSTNTVSGSGVYDLVSPIPPFMGDGDDAFSNATVNNHHQVYDVNHNRLDYQGRLKVAMDQGQMGKFTSAGQAMLLYNRYKMTDPNVQKKMAPNDFKQGIINGIKNGNSPYMKATSMMVDPSEGMSKEQILAIAPMLQKIGLDVSDLRPGPHKELANTPGILAVPDSNGVRRKLRNGKLAKDVFNQMDAGSEFMQMIDGSDGGDFVLPDGMTVDLPGGGQSHSISILPQSLRKSRRSQSNGRTTVDDYTRDYAQVGVGIKRYQVAVKALELTMPKYDPEFFANQKAYQDYQKERNNYLKAAKQEIWQRSGVQAAVDRINNRMVESVFGKDNASIKTNFIRQRIMSNRVKSSSTAVQTNGYDLPIDTIEVSPDILKSLGMQVDPKTGYAYSPVPDDPNNKSWDMIHVHRDPVWRSHGSLGFRVKVNPSIAGVRVSPVVVSLMDGDFDGDTIGLIAVADEGGQRDLHGPVNVLSNVYDKKDANKLGSTDLNVSAELVDLAGRGNFKMDMAKAFGGRMSASILKQTGTTNADWNFGPIMQEARDGNGSSKVAINQENAKKLLAVAKRLYPDDESLQKNFDHPETLNVKDVLKVYYAVGLDVGQRYQQGLVQQNYGKGTLQEPKHGEMGWYDGKNLTKAFIDNTDKSIRTGNPRRLEQAGVNFSNNKEDSLEERAQNAKQSYSAYVERGAKGSPSAIAEMFGPEYLANQPLYDPTIMTYADAMKSFKKQLGKYGPEAITKDEHGNETVDLSKIQDPQFKQDMTAEFQKIHDRFLDPSKREIFVKNKENIARQLDQLSTIMDATKEKSDLTGQPGGWQKKLVAALADRGPQGLALANAIGYVMTQATLQVKHDPVLAHKLADMEVNGMSSLYGAKYETRPLMLGLVGNKVTMERNGNVLVPLGKNSFVAGVNQEILMNQIDAWKQDPNFLKQHQLNLDQQDFSFHNLSHDELHKVAGMLYQFNPQNPNGKPLTDQQLAQGLDRAVRPMFSRWDPETGKQLDVENGFNKYQARGLDPLTGEADRIPAKELNENLKQMFKQSEVDPGVNVKQAIKLLMTEDKNGEWVVMSLKDAQEQNAGTMMSAKMQGLDPIAQQAKDNTKAILDSGEDTKAQSLFVQDNDQIVYQTIAQRKRSLDQRGIAMMGNYSKMFNDCIKNTKKLAPGIKKDLQVAANGFSQIQRLGKESPQATVLMSKRMKQMRQYFKNQAVQKQKDGTYTKQDQEILKQLAIADAIMERNNQELNDIPNQRVQYINRAQKRVLQRYNLPTNMKRWEKVAKSRPGMTKTKFNEIKSQLETAKKEAQENFDHKAIPFIEHQYDGSQPKTSYMNEVFMPKQLSAGKVTAADIRASQIEFVKDPHVQAANEVNTLILKAIKHEHLQIGGLKKPEGQHVSKIDEALIAKHNCQKILKLANSQDKNDVAAFKKISQALSGVDLKIGKHANKNKFERQMQEMVNGIDSAQTKLIDDPMVHNQVNKVDANKASDQQLRAFKRQAESKLAQYGLDRNNAKVTHAKSSDGRDLQAEANKEQYKEYFKKEEARKKALEGKKSQFKKQSEKEQPNKRRTNGSEDGDDLVWS